MPLGGCKWRTEIGRAGLVSIGGIYATTSLPFILFLIQPRLRMSATSDRSADQSPVGWFRSKDKEEARFGRLRAFYGISRTSDLEQGQ